MTVKRGQITRNNFSAGGKAVGREGIQRKPARSAASARRGDDRRAEAFWLYGRHTVLAALKNPNRVIKRLVATKNASRWLLTEGMTPDKYAVTLEDLMPSGLDGMLPKGAVHQGLAVYVKELPRQRLRDICRAAQPQSIVLVLDQVTDPQNIGAVIRSAVAFGVEALIVQDRRTPPLSGALAKAAAGGIDQLPVIRVVNIARALEALQEIGYYCLGLSGDGEQAIKSAKTTHQPSVLVLGAEGTGLRALTAQTCDMLACIPIKANMESLNISTAAAIALYELTQA